MKRVWTWPIAIVVFLGLIAALNIGVLIAGLSTRDELVEDQTYERGLVYEETLKELRRPDELGWRLTDEPLSDGSVKFTVLDNGGSVLSATSCMALLKCAADSRSDQHVVLNTESPAPALLEARLPLKGIWLLDLSCETAQGRVRWKKRLVH